MTTMPAFDPSKYIIKLKGKDYLEVKWRLVWFRETHPDGAIDTENIALTEQLAVFKATVQTPSGGRATGYGSESPKDFGDYIEKAETKALGRALGALGFGTQFTDDFDEGTDNPVDAPRQPRQAPAPTPARAQQTATNVTPLDVDASRMKRLHAVAAARGLNHDELHAIAKGRGKDSLKELTGQEMDTFTNWLEKVSPPALQVAIDAGRQSIETAK
jgi:hypothetical protein